MALSEGSGAASCVIMGKSTKSVNDMPCALCGESKKLIDAHIIPRPFYPAVEGAEAVILTGPDNLAYPKRAPVGVYDQNILCAECDAELGVLDQHAVEHLLRGKSRSFIHQGRAVGKTYTTADTDTLLRFVVAVAWRASIASHQMFEGIATGPYESAMLEVLKGGDIGSFDAIIAEFDEDAVGFLNPHHSRFDGIRFMVIYAGRFVLYLKLDKRQMPYTFRASALRLAGAVHTVVRDYSRSKEFDLLRMIFEQPHLEPMRRKWAAGPKRKKA